MTSTDRVKPNRARLKVEMVLCLGPTFLYLLTGVVLVPHQLQLLVREGVVESLWVLLYYVGIIAMFIAVRSMYNHMTGDPIGIIRPRSALICIAAGFAALAMGPGGAFVLGGADLMVPMLTIPLLALPALCLLHLAFMSREYLQRALRPKT